MKIEFSEAVEYCNSNCELTYLSFGVKGQIEDELQGHEERLMERPLEIDGRSAYWLF